MDIATITGLLATFALVVIAIGPGSLGGFVNAPSILITVGGTFGATLVAFPLGEVLGVGAVIKNTVFNKSRPLADVISQLVDFSTKARRDGILALENAIKEVDDPFMTRGIQLAVDGQEPEAIETILTTDIEAMTNRHRKGAEILGTMGALAPAMGMIGTLVGLVLMLQNMSDPSTIGPAMAVALLTTFYGALMANVVFNPLSTKLRLRSSEEINLKELIREGILSIAAGDNPRIVEQRLHAYLQPKHRVSAFD